LTGTWLLLLVAWQAEDGARLSTSDLPAYLEALEAKGEAEPVTFRDLWDRPGSHRGRRVRVEGRLARRFAQPAFGAFPPLVEAWIITPGDNPICLVYPEGGGGPPLGATVAFSGTYLRRVRYPGGDAERLAPLIVGGGRPSAVSKPRARADSAVRLPSWVYWSACLAVVASLALLVAWLQIQGGEGRSGRPIPPTRVEFEEDDGGGPEA
jgi:hypothetical protein